MSEYAHQHRKCPWTSQMRTNVWMMGCMCCATVVRCGVSSRVAECDVHYDISVSTTIGRCRSRNKLLFTSRYNSMPYFLFVSVPLWNPKLWVRWLSKRTHKFSVSYHATCTCWESPWPHVLSGICLACCVYWRCIPASCESLATNRYVNR